MEEAQIKQLWESYYNERVAENLLLGKKNALDISKLKVQSLLGSMKPLKIFAILVGILWVGFVDGLIIDLFQVASPFFLISAGIHVVLTKLAIGVYAYQLVLLHQVDISEPILATQEKIAHLKTSTIWVARLLFLQLPLWTTFYWNESMLKNGNVVLYTLQIMFTLSFTYLAIWLFRNINYKNRDKKWFGLIFTGGEWNPMVKSMELLQQIDAYKIENKA